MNESGFTIQMTEIPHVRGFEYTRRYIKDCKTFKMEMVPLPARKTANSAGYDFMSPISYTLYPHEYVKLMLGVKAYMPQDEYLALHIRSSLGIKKNLVLMNTVGIIDSDYYDNPDNEGEIIACIMNMSDDPVTIEAGERVVQGIFSPYFTTDNDDDNIKVVRTGGIGSTNK